MKKIFLIIVFVFFAFNLALADDSQRQISSGQKTSNTVIKSTAGKLYGISIVATAATNGWATVYDSSDSDTTGDTILGEVSEATQFNSQRQKWEEGLNAYEGIYLQVGNAKAIVYYY